VVVNNPFSTYLDLELRNSGSQVKLQLINGSGMVVAEKMVYSPQGQIRWNLPENLSRGHYFLKAFAGGELFVHKVVKQ
jgi:hypothetical protein